MWILTCVHVGMPVQLFGQLNESGREIAWKGKKEGGKKCRFLGSVFR